MFASAVPPGCKPHPDRGKPRGRPTACRCRLPPGRECRRSCAATTNHPRRQRVVGPADAPRASRPGPASSPARHPPAPKARKRPTIPPDGFRATPGSRLPAPPARPRPDRLQSPGAAQGSRRRMQAMTARWDSSTGVVRPTRYPNRSGSCCSTNWTNASRSVGDAVAQTRSRYRVSMTSSSRMPRRQRQRSRAMFTSSVAVTCPHQARRRGPHPTCGHGPHPTCGHGPHPTCGRPLPLTRER